MLIKRIHHSSESSDNPYELSFSDMMSGLLMVFILATMVLVLQLVNVQIDIKTEKENLTKAEKVRQDLLLDIQNTLNKEEIEVFLSENNTVLRIPEKVISFESASFQLPSGEENERRITRIGEVIEDKLNKPGIKNYIDTVFIEGHTDSQPYNDPRIKGNWGLSTFRAIQLWEFWANSQGKASNLSKIENKDKKMMFSVSGYAHSRPIICIDGVTDPSITSCTTTYPKERANEAHSKNRRIDIRFTIRKPESKEFEGF